MIDSVKLNGIGMTSERTRRRLITRLQESGIRDAEVLDVMLALPRHIFLDEALAHRAYEDTALPIGYNQTLSQPYIVAKMTETLIAQGKPRKVLEIGTGSGYQTAVLAKLVGKVYSVERIKPLQDKARERLNMLKLRNVSLMHTDGGMGWPSEAPFDGILVTAAPTQVPEALLEQLAVGGRLVIPVGGDDQLLKVIDKTEEGLSERTIEAVRFVPLIRGS